jgi:DNA-directed RNA polymerase specialized sigma24 family protein
VNTFAILFERYKAQVLRIVKKHVPRHEVEETVQTVMVKAYQSLKGFDPGSDFKKSL